MRNSTGQPARASDDPRVAAIAEAFAEVMRQWLSREEFAEMKRRNESGGVYAGCACASHDFCDANMAMLAAFESAGVKTCLDFEDGTPEHEAACHLWNDAWALARKLYLGC